WESDIEVMNKGNIRPKKVSLPSRKVQNPSRLDFEYVSKTMSHYETNSLVGYLSSHFGISRCRNLIQRYYLGTSKHWGNIGATVFWQIDYSGQVRSGKVMAYDSLTGKRLKKPFNYITWVHKILKITDFHLEQCYFGEHLLSENLNSLVAIVESEKTAIIASLYFPEFIWIAAGSLNNISVQRSNALYQRDIVLFPDLSGNGRAF